MKKKILLPVFSVASIATIVTPLVTSCNDNKPQKSEFTYDLTHIEEWQPSITPKAKDKIDENEITRIYLTDITKNKQILADDWISTWGEPLKEFYHTATLTIGEIQPSESLVSMNYDLQGETMSQIGRLTNIPFAVQYHTEEPIGWGVGTTIDSDGKYLLQTEGWAFYLEQHIQGQDPVIHDYDYQKLQDDPNKEETAKAIAMNIMTYSTLLSYYLKLITPK